MTTPALASLGNFGPALTLEWKGKVLSAKLVDQIMKTAIEEEIYQRRMKPIYDLGTRLPAPLIQGMVDNVSREYMRGELGMFSEAGKEYLSSLDGNLSLVSKVLSISIFEALDLLADKPVEVSALLTRVIALSFPSMHNDPRPPA